MLDVSYNCLKAINSSISQLQHLEEASFDTNDISSLPSELFQTKSLTTLYLQHNRLDHHGFPPDAAPGSDKTMHYLQRILVLDLSFNRLGEIPPHICALSSLHELYLANNKLTYIREENFPLSNLRELRVLDISNNSISKIGRVASE